MANEEAMRRVGENLKRARKNKGLTQGDLASLIPGQSKPQISAYENGKRDVPRDKVERFAEVLGISPMSLIPLEEWSRPEEPELNEEEGKVMVDLHQRRKELGLTMKQVADAVGVSETTIIRYESGNIRNMRRDRIDKYAKVLRVSLLDMIEFGDQVKEPTVITRLLPKFRMEKGISMRKAAMDMGLPYTTYVSYEKGEREPNIAGLIKLADYFGCTVDYLVRGKAPREAPGTIPEAARDHIMQRFCNTV